MGQVSLCGLYRLIVKTPSLSKCTKNPIACVHSKRALYTLKVKTPLLLNNDVIMTQWPSIFSNNLGELIYHDLNSTGEKFLLEFHGSSEIAKFIFLRRWRFYAWVFLINNFNESFYSQSVKIV